MMRLDLGPDCESRIYPWCMTADELEVAPEPMIPVTPKPAPKRKKRVFGPTGSFHRREQVTHRRSKLTFRRVLGRTA